jgi:hypothetical protein
MRWNRPPAAALAAVGMALLFAPGLFVTASLLKYLLGIGFLYDALAGLFSSRPADGVPPVLLVSGVVIALALNVYAVGDLIRRTRGAGRAVNLVLIAGSSLALTVLLGYVVLEHVPLW